MRSLLRCALTCVVVLAGCDAEPPSRSGPIHRFESEAELTRYLGGLEPPAAPHQLAPPSEPSTIANVGDTLVVLRGEKLAAISAATPAAPEITDVVPLERTVRYDA